jgi:dehydrogenase/reductase SDR family protein 7
MKKTKGLLLIAALAIFLGIFAKFDGDLTLMLHEQFPGRNLTDKVVWITGASSGIGAQMAYELTKQGAQVIISARRVDRLEEVAERCNGTHKPFIYPLDVLDNNAQKDATKHILEKFGRVDILFLNAGKSQRGTALETNLDITKNLMEINFFSVIGLSNELLPHLVQNPGSQIVVTSSFAGKFASPLLSSYAASKHALHGYFETLRSELGPKSNVSITMLLPGPVHSEISQSAFRTSSQPAHDPEETKMSVERCAKLMTTAIRHRLAESWIIEQPILLFAYIGEYFPNLFRLLGRIIGIRRVKTYLRGEDPYKVSNFFKN